MEKVELRNKLFEKYFEVDDGVELGSFVKRVAYIQKIYQELQKIFEANVEEHDCFCSISKIKEITHNDNKYLIVKTFMCRYLIIDLVTKKSLTEEEIISKFDEKFFINNFSEKEVGDDFEWFWMYDFLTYIGDTQVLIDFYDKNKMIFDVPTKIFYKLEIGEAWTYLSINLAECRAQMGFETIDQFLYEHLFLKGDLTPSSMQDSQSRIGVAKMKEMFERIPTIKLPYSLIPMEFMKNNMIDCKDFERQKFTCLKLVKKK